ncbi:MAG TPA: 4-(cytidine 5'-diphospho)-2-C-methyl-D-erythritol kinase [Candidatus Limnocylindria bacterium]
MTVPLRLEAPAKLNLRLAVTGRRPDGYHTLDTDLVLLELADRLLLMPGCSGLRVEAAPDEDVPRTPGENLAWRGLVAGLEEEPLLACLTLEKRVPSAAGLGGGSSDAAAAWRLGRRWRGLPDGSGVDAGTLDVLSRIGADVPFFAAGHAVARVGGIGEQVAPLAPPAGGVEVVLVHPPFRLATAAVFAELRPDEWGAAGEGGNDLLAPATRVRPELADVVRLVTGAGGRPQLSGSGPTFFVRTDDPERADAVAGRLARAGLRTSRTRLRLEPARIETLSDEEDG